MSLIKFGKERRQSVRFYILSIVKYASDFKDAPFRVANIQDVSRGGLTFFSEQEIKEGDILHFCFLPPNRKKPVEVRGKIVRCLPTPQDAKIFTIGVQFLDVPEEANLVIQELEAAHLARRRQKSS